MTTIGTFTKKDNRFDGRIDILAGQIPATFEPTATKTNDKAPDYRVIVKGREIGAAWSKTAKSGATYLSAKIDNPTFPAPINCSLLEAESGYSLIWNRA